MNFSKMLINFRKSVTVALIFLMYIGKEDIFKYMRYEVTMTVYMGSITNQRKVP